eukprot:3170611-Rhodomonas_salina.1
MARRRNGSPSDRPKKYGVLSPDAVREIFLQRPSRNDDGTFKPSSEASHRLAAVHGVTERAIREIWNRRSWADITRLLCTDAEMAAASAASEPSKSAPGMAKLRRVGRPKGSKDAIKPALESAASSPTSPTDTAASPSPVMDFAKAVESAETGDPFEEDWEAAVKLFELGTMVWNSEVTAGQELSGRGEEGGEGLEMFLETFFGQEAFAEHWQGVSMEVPWH